LAPERRLRADVVVSVAATVISLCALVTTAWQTRIMREQQQTAVWPRLQLAHGYYTDPARAFYRLQLTNQGVGPAILTHVSVKYRGVEVNEMGSVLAQVAEEHKELRQGDIADTNHSEPVPEDVVAPQQTIELLYFKGAPWVSTFVEARRYLEVTVQYASIYGELWEVTYPKPSYRRVGWRRD
jgi:hypothetical protein